MGCTEVKTGEDMNITLILLMAVGVLAALLFESEYHQRKMRRDHIDLLDELANSLKEVEDE